MTVGPVVVASRYRLGETLGVGGMGRVFLARDEVLDRDVAIKEIVPPEDIAEADRDAVQQRTLREARAAARISHPNAAQVYDVIAADGATWIVMEYVKSRSLKEVIDQEGPLEPRRVAEIGLAVLNALDASHRAGVRHRDVKPANVLLGDDGRVVLTDFGIATIEGDGIVTSSNMVLGSPQYMSPERVRDGTTLPASDLWSLGATLYTAVEGHSPYERGSVFETLTAVASDEPAPAGHAGVLAPVLEGLLRKDPAARIDLEEARELLEEVASGETAAPPRPRWPWSGWRDRDRNTPARVTAAPASPAPAPAAEPDAKPAPTATPDSPPAPSATPAPAATRDAPPASTATPHAEPAPTATRDAAPTAAPDAQPTQASAAAPALAPASGVPRQRVPEAETITETGVAAAPLTQAEPATKAEPAAEAAPITEAGPIAEAAPITEAEPAAEAAPITEARPTTEAEPIPEAEPAAKAAPITEARPTTEAEPEAETAPPRGTAPVPAPRTSAPRRRSLLAAGVAAVVLAGAGTTWWSLHDDSDGTPRTSPTVAPTASAQATTVPGSTGPGSTGQGTASANPAGVPAGSAPAPSATPASSAPTGRAGNPVARPPLPDGWRDYRDPTGFRLYVPEGWSRSKEGSIVYFRDGKGHVLGIDQTNSPQWNPVADWKGKAKYRVSIGDFPGYKEIKIVPVKYWLKAADWEFTFNGSNRRHVNNRGLITSKKQAYGIWWETSDSRWKADRDDLQLIFDSFRPKT
ncbi:protein kinase domain-containing protein [Actinoplanes sp. NPDC004185]